MSRRDTIIIAVLVNAGLLIILFATALKSDSSSEIALEPAPVAESIQPVAQELRKTAEIIPAPVAAAPTMPAPAVEEKIPNFAEDLKAITFTEQPSLTPPPIAAASPQEERQIPVETQTQAPQFSEYKVKKGDVLEKIARIHGSSVQEIMKSNHLANTNLKIGQVLRIPRKEGRKATASKTPDLSPKYYTVKNGDNPWTIAVKNHMKVEELLKLNNLNAESARRLKPGDQLRIR